MKGCLLIHGYTGGPFEVKPIADYLSKHNILTLCPTLPGHENQKKLKPCHYEEWIVAVEKSYIELSKKCSEIAVIGFSMGGLLSFHLLQKHKVKCFISIGTPIYCFDCKNLLVDLIYRLKIKDKNRIKEYIRGCFTPMKANLNFKRLLRKTKPIIPNTKIPIFIIQGKKDPIVKYKSAQYIYDQVQSKNKKIKFYNEAKHRIHEPKTHMAIYHDIYLFIKEYL